MNNSEEPHPTKQMNVGPRSAGAKKRRVRHRLTADVGSVVYDLVTAKAKARGCTKSQVIRDDQLAGDKPPRPKPADPRDPLALLVYVAQELHHLEELHVPQLSREEHAKLMVVSIVEIADMLRAATKRPKSPEVDSTVKLSGE